MSSEESTGEQRCRVFYMLIRLIILRAPLAIFRTLPFFFPDLVVACDRRGIMEEFLTSYHQSTFLLQVPLLNAEHEFVHEARVRTLRYRLSMNHHARVIQVRRNLTHSFTHLSVLGVIMHI